MSCIVVGFCVSLLVMKFIGVNLKNEQYEKHVKT